MTDEIEQGPDPNEVRRHAKKMHTELEYRQKYRRIDFYKPNRSQLLFHALQVPEKALRAGNQLGKTHGAGAEFAFQTLARYPDWWRGRKFVVPPKIERPIDFMGWASCTTSTKVRDGSQLKLLGPVRDQGGLGTGLIPLDNIVGRPTMARGIADFVDTATIRRETGGIAHIQFKTYEMGREAYQGTPVDVNWLDEDVSREDDSIYGECIARKTTTRGIIMCSLTPLLGLSPLRKRFKERANGDCAEILMTIDDCAVSVGGHIPDEDIPGIIASYKESERATRAYGADMQGEGAVFEIPEETIKHSRDPATFPPYWRWLWACDFSHAGLSASSHPFAAVLGCHDTDNDVIYIVEAIRLRQMLPIQHVARIKENPCWDAPWAWPHDGNNQSGIESSETYAAVYRRLGLKMLATHATFKDGGYNLGSGIAEMEQRFATGRLLVAKHLGDWFDEYRGYHRVNNLIHKVDDDLMSATRVLCMQIRSAKTLDPYRPGTGPFARRQEAVSVPYRGGPLHSETEDVFGGHVGFDVFTGQ
jgi:phage terminase large subunit-like protein